MRLRSCTGNFRYTSKVACHWCSEVFLDRRLAGNCLRNLLRTPAQTSQRLKAIGRSFVLLQFVSHTLSTPSPPLSLLQLCTGAAVEAASGKDAPATPATPAPLTNFPPFHRCRTAPPSAGLPSLILHRLHRARPILHRAREAMAITAVVHEDVVLEFWGHAHDSNPRGYPCLAYKVRVIICTVVLRRSTAYSKIHGLS